MPHDNYQGQILPETISFSGHGKWLETNEKNDQFKQKFAGSDSKKCFLQILSISMTQKFLINMNIFKLNKENDKRKSSK